MEQYISGAYLSVVVVFLLHLFFTLLVLVAFSFLFCSLYRGLQSSPVKEKTNVKNESPIKQRDEEEEDSKDDEESEDEWEDVEGRGLFFASVVIIFVISELVFMLKSPRFYRR